MWSIRAIQVKNTFLPSQNVISGHCATSLGSLAPSNQSYDEYFQTNSFSSLVSDQDCLDCMKEFSRQERVLIEPACAAGICSIDTREKLENICQNWRSSNGNVNFEEVKNIVIEVCGGNLVDPWYQF